MASATDMGCCDPHRLGMAGAGGTGYGGRPGQRSCDPHRLGMAGAGVVPHGGGRHQAGVAILTDLEWPVLACRSAGPCRAPRSCDPHRLGMAGAGTLTGPKIGERAKVLRSSPTWNGRCWMIAMPSKTSPPGVAILTDLEWPVLAESFSTGAPAAVTLRSSPTWNGRCWEPAP